MNGSRTQRRNFSETRDAFELECEINNDDLETRLRFANEAHGDDKGLERHRRRGCGWCGIS